MRAMDLMASPVVTARPGTPAEEAARLLAAHTCAALPVANDDGELLGTVTGTDLVRNRVLPGYRPSADHSPRPTADPARILVDDVMAPAPVAVAPSTDAAAVARLARDVDGRLARACWHTRVVDVTDGVVCIATEGDDPQDRRRAQILAAARPGVLDVRVAPSHGGRGDVRVAATAAAGRRGSGPRDRSREDTP